MTQGPRVGFFAGVPVSSEDGDVLGVLFVADTEPREAFAAEDVEALKKLASLVTEVLGRRARENAADEAPDRVRNGGEAFHVGHRGDEPTPGAVDGLSLGAAPWFETVANLIPQIVWSTTPDGYHDYFNDRWYAYTGMPRAGDQGWNWNSYLHPEDVERTLEAWHHALASGEPYEVQYRFRRASDGEYRWYIGRAMPLSNAAGEIVRWFGTCTDVHEERMAEDRRKRVSEFRHAVMSLVEDSLTARCPDEFYQHVLERAVGVIPGAQAGSVLFQAPDGMFEFVASVGYDLSALRPVRFRRDQVTLMGERSTQPIMITDFSAGAPESAQDRSIMESAGRTAEIAVSLSIPVVLEGDATAFLTLDNFESRTAFGDEAVEMARIFAGYVATLAQRFRLERQLHRLAYEDGLTELPNRAAFDDRMAEMFERADRLGQTAAVLFMDLDGFKAVNDTLGHGVGDEVLQWVGRRLLGCVRAGEVVGRLGGDEFAIVLQSDDAPTQSKRVAERVLETIARPITTRAGIVRVTASVGIAIYPSDGETPQGVLASADDAMYRAKEIGKNAFRFFGGDGPTGGSE